MNGIIGLLQQHRNGATQDEIADALRDLVAAISDENKAGKLTITIAIRPMGKGDGLDVAVDCKASPPKQTPGSAIFFASPDNNLVRNDPRQANLELRDITPASAARGLA